MIPFIQRFFDTKTFLKHKGPPTKLFGAVKQKSPTKSWYRFFPYNFWFQNVSETQKGSPMMLFGDVWQKNQQIRDTLLSKKFFDTRTFLKHKAPFTNNYRTVRQKRSTIRDTPTTQKNFDTRTFLKHRRVRPHFFSAIWDKKTSGGKTWHPPSYP